MVIILHNARMAIVSTESGPGNPPPASHPPDPATTREHFLNGTTLLGEAAQVAGGIVDTTITSLAVQSQSGLVEENPLTSHFIEHGGVPEYAGAQAVATLICVAALGYLRSLDMYHQSINPARKFKWYKTAVIMANVLRWAPTAWNAVVLLSSLHH